MIVEKEEKDVGKTVQNFLSRLEEKEERERKQNKEKNDKNELFKMLLDYTSYFLYLVIMVLFVFILGRVLSVGMWQGLGLQMLWGLNEWYWKALTIGIIAAVIGAFLYVLYKGFHEIFD